MMYDILAASIPAIILTVIMVVTRNSKDSENDANTKNEKV